MRQRTWAIVWTCGLLAVFLFRLAFGLCSLLYTEDETQIYLLGLRYHATHAWPFFGPDVVWTESQIPGSLQALLVGVPFDVLPIPEAPYILLTLLSTGSLALFAWYLCLRLPELPRWLVWGWLMTLPWTLELSTHVINPSYVLPASLLFFIAWFEAWPRTSMGRIPPVISFLVMGAAIPWVAQVHMSWPLLLPFAGIAFLARVRQSPRTIALSAAAFALGVAATGAFVLPTWLEYGWLDGSGGTGANIAPNWRNPVTTFVTTLARLLAFASYEVNRFIATGSARQTVFLQDHWWLIPAAAILWLIGLLHPFWMALTAFRRSSRHTAWPAVRWTLVGAAALVSISFFFSAAPAQARSFYLMAPVGFVYAAYAWTFVDSRRARAIAGIVLGLNVFLQASLAATRVSGPSLYMNRERVLQAIRLDRPELFAHRRGWGRDVTPPLLVSSIEGADPARDLAVTQRSLRQAFRELTVWSIVVHNRSSHLAYRDLTSEISYFDAAGQVLDVRREPVWLMIEPGESRAVQVVDGARWRADFARAEIRIAHAEPLLTQGR